MEGEGVVEPSIRILAVMSSVVVCMVLYKVRMRQCEAVLEELTRELDDVRRTTEALQTRLRVLNAAALTAERALAEYNKLLDMLQQLHEVDQLQPDLPILRHQIETETMRAQVSIVQGCMLAMSEEVLSSLPCDKYTQQNDVMMSLNQRRKSYNNLSQELLSFLNKK